MRNANFSYTKDVSQKIKRTRLCIVKHPIEKIEILEPSKFGNHNLIK